MITVVVTITCDWCKHQIVSTHPFSTAARTRLRLDDAADAAWDLEQRMVAQGRGVPIGSPPDDQRHLCNQCETRGTPPATNAGHTARQKAEKATARQARKAAA